MPRTRTELLVKEVFISQMTWKDLEAFFSLNKYFLRDELKAFFENVPNGLDRFTNVCEKISSNQSMLNAEYER